MTTRRSSDSVQALMRVARALRFAMILQGAVRWGVLSAGALLALLLIDDLLHLPQALRLPLGVVLAGFIVIEFYRKVGALALHRFSPARAARWLEVNRGIRDNLLINAYQFDTTQSQSEWAKFTQTTLSSSGTALAQIAPRSLWLTPRLTRWVAGLVILAAAWTLLAVVFPRYVTIGIERIFLPLADIPPVGNWVIDVTPSHRISLVEGDRFDITVHLKSALGLTEKAPVPELIWQSGDSALEEMAATGQRAAMLPGANSDEFTFSFSSVSQPFTFSVAADDSRSSSVQVDVVPLPQLKASAFYVTPPAYTGVKPYAQPGPPEALEVPIGSTVKSSVELSPDSPKVVWRNAGDAGAGSTGEAKSLVPSSDATSTDMVKRANGWETSRAVDESNGYQILITMPGLSEPRLLAQGQITAVPDHPPEVDFVTDDRNRAVMPGGTLPVKIRATDDYGVASIALQIAASDDPTHTRVIKTWSYLGPPGEKQPSPENYAIQLDPDLFTPGSTYLVTASASDFSPGQQKTTSPPIVVRVAGMDDIAVPQGDPLSKLVELLKNTIAQQTQANGLTNNLALHLSEALEAGDVPKHGELMAQAQAQAQDLGNSALAEASAHDEGKAYLARLGPLVHGEMDLAKDQVGHLPSASSDALPPMLDALQKRQSYILNGLLALLGQIADDRRQAADVAAAAKKDVNTPPPAVTTEQELAKLKDELKSFADTQKRIIDASNTFKEVNPQDLTTDQQQALGELAREEAKQAAYFQNKLTDFSKLSMQDFADGKLVNDMNEVYQEVQKASESLYQKRVEIAVAGETAGLEKAEEIEQNLERWLPNTPDNTKWSMEEPQGQQDIPMAELPKQLDDLIGDLLNKEDQMDPDKDDVSSSIMDSMDKGAGWGAGDGPMSNMSAKGVTGNQLPNNMELSGRSGEGRNGKSDGEMVGNTAVGKGGNETPTRMSSAPYENGSVNDQSKTSKGGATGGGKLAGAGEDGLRGPMPPAVQQRVRMLANQQSKLRQQAESLALSLRKQRRPTGDLESAINAMKQFEAAANRQDGLSLTQGYHQAIDSLQAARSAYAGDRLSRVEADTLTRDAHSNTVDAQAEDAPAGYEEMTGAYFRSLSESASAPSSPPASSPTPQSPPAP